MAKKKKASRVRSFVTKLGAQVREGWTQITRRVKQRGKKKTAAKKTSRKKK